MIKIKESIIKNFFQYICDEDSKILVWLGSEGNYEYSIYKESDFVNCINEAAEKHQEDLIEMIIDYTEDGEIDIDNIEEELFNRIYEIEFDFDTKGWKEFYDPKNYLNDEDYKYTYLITYYASAEGNGGKTYLEKIIHSNKEKITDELLKKNNIDIPSEFGVEWANHNLSELSEWENKELYDIYDPHQELEYETYWID